MNTESLYTYYKNCDYTVNTDSRKQIQNSLFFALKGESFDGNLYAQQALENGAAYAVIDNPKLKDKNKRFIYVENSLVALQKLAQFHRRSLKTPIIGITGTNGKTTTKELITAVLSKRYNVHYTKGNFNNHIGVPLTLLDLRKQHELAVVEMGASHPGEIAELTALVEPNFGLITNIGKGHLEGFGSFEGVIKTKKELYDYLSNDPLSTLFINTDDLLLNKLAKDIPNQFTYSSKSTDADITGTINNNKATIDVTWHTKANNFKQLIKSRLIGDYNLDNILAAIAIGCYFQVESQDINDAISLYTPTNNRSQLKKTTKNTLIIDAYNANPTSMKAAIENFEKLESELPKMVILGNMGELGKDSPNEHEKIITLLNSCSNLKQIILIGEYFEAINHSFLQFKSTDDFKAYLNNNIIEGYSILIKGSNSLKLYSLDTYL